MVYQSTRGQSERVSAAEAIVRGLAEDGGLYVPERFPAISAVQLADMIHMPYQQLATQIMGMYLGDFSAEEVQQMVDAAYGDNFDNKRIAPLKKLNAHESVLELFHGPSLAFKDMALQILPHLMTRSMRKTGESKQVLILVATSGDTGKAALEGFCDVPDTCIQVFYPEGGVSPAQQRQMLTQRGKNVRVTAVKGNFDDTQSGVKRIFSDAEMAETVAAQGYRFSSANSINWGRLLPQVVYYFSAYMQAVKAGCIDQGEKLNFVVPTGNFGNILAGYYAKQMGLPVGKLICASNRNNVLTDFFTNGVYDRRRAFYQTNSPSMDILISSNLERLLYEVCGRDSKQVRLWMQALQKEGHYALSQQQKEALAAEFYAGYCDDQAAKDTIAKTWQKDAYLLDTHTAVAQCVYEDYREHTGDRTATVLISTASPFKFAADVLEAIAPEARQTIDAADPFAGADALAKASALAVPKGIDALRALPILHDDKAQADEMAAAVLRAIDSWNR